MVHVFDDAVVAAVRDHMNDDHADDTLLICRAFAGRPDATAARIVSLDGGGLDVGIATPDGEVRGRVAFRNAITERAEIRAEIVALYADARAALGLPPDERTS